LSIFAWVSSKALKEPSPVVRTFRATLEQTVCFMMMSTVEETFIVYDNFG